MGKQLDAAVLGIEKQFGKGSVMRLGSKETMKVQTISSGCISLDAALGGGFPKGRIVEVYGPEASGKTTMALELIASAQRAEGECAFLDLEHALDPEYARALGVDINKLFISQPDDGEQALEIVEALVKSNELAVIVVDSVAALVPRAELEGEMGQSMMGLQARLMSQGLRKLTAAVHKSECILLFINQLREKLGVVFGSPEVTTGGKALKFYASVRLDVRRTGQIKEGDEVRGAKTKVKVVKNKIAPPFRETIIDIMFGKGICKAADLFDFSILRGVVKQQGAWYSMDEEKLGQGRERVVSRMETDKELFCNMEARVRKLL